MTWVEHYEAAERLLEQAAEVGARVGPESAQAVATQALAHATLATTKYTPAPTYTGADKRSSMGDSDPWPGIET